ncbi:hypothetical protein B0H12DRAFT_1114029 [Mycena haematopus]|nr:hypothetical protein B0H12DRAFT_1114029 [Mycena haematopus]
MRVDGLKRQFVAVFRICTGVMVMCISTSVRSLANSIFRTTCMDHQSSSQVGADLSSVALENWRMYDSDGDGRSIFRVNQVSTVVHVYSAASISCEHHNSGTPYLPYVEATQLSSSMSGENYDL